MEAEGVFGTKSEANKDSFTESPVPQDEDFICWICLCWDEEEPLISVCRCKGSIAKVHKSCLERWLESSNRTRCEICKFTYNMERKVRYNKWQSIGLWLVEVVDRNVVLLSCCILTLQTIMMAGVMYYATIIFFWIAEDNTGNLYSEMLRYVNIPRCVAVALFIVVNVLECLVARILYLMWRSWDKNHFTVTVLPYTGQ